MLLVEAPARSNVSSRGKHSVPWRWEPWQVQLDPDLAWSLSTNVFAQGRIHFENQRTECLDSLWSYMDYARMAVGRLLSEALATYIGIV